MVCVCFSFELILKQSLFLMWARYVTTVFEHDYIQPGIFYNVVFYAGGEFYDAWCKRWSSSGRIWETSWQNNGASFEKSKGTSWLIQCYVQYTSHGNNVLVFQQWGQMSNQQSSIQEFLENLEKFVNILSGAKNNMDGRVKLGEHGLNELLDSLNTPTDYLTAGMY